MRFVGMVLLLALAGPARAAIDWDEPPTGLEQEALANPDFHWSLLQGERCRVHYLAGTFAARHIDALTRSADGAVAKTLAALGEERYERPVDVFYIGSREEMIALVGVRATGYADWRSSSVFLVCNPEWRTFDVHEITHVIAASLWGVPAEPVWWIREGLSVAVDGRCRDHGVDQVAAEMLRRGDLPNPRDLIEHFADQGELRGYLASGSLVAFLLERYGPGKVREIWQRGGGEIEKILGTDLDALDGEWRAALDGVEGRIAPEEWEHVMNEGCG